MVVQLSSRNRCRHVVALAVVVLSGCASDAPPLPADTTSVNRTQTLAAGIFDKNDMALSCDQIVTERNGVDQRINADNTAIEGNRTTSQVGLFVGGVLAAPFIPENKAEKDEIARLYGRRDTLTKLFSYKSCQQ